MKRIGLAAWLGCAALAAACSPIVKTSPDASTPVASSMSSRDATDASFYFLIDEVGLGPKGYITLRNFTNVAASLDTVYLCQSGGCVDLPDVTAQPNETVRIAVGDGAGLENVVMTGASLDLPPPDGEVAIYASDDIRDPTKMRYYVQWGSTPHGLTDIAVEANLSGTTTYAPSGPKAIRLWKNEGGVWVWDSE